MLFELRIYRTRPGQRAAWVKFFEEEIIPYLHAKGMVVVGTFVGEQDEDQARPAEPARVQLHHGGGYPWHDLPVPLLAPSQPLFLLAPRIAA